MGHPHIVLIGFSMGASIVTYYQATAQREEVVAVGSLAHPASLPDSLRRRWERFGADPDYEAVADRAAQIVAAGDHADQIFIVERATGPTQEPSDAEIWTYRTLWHSRGPQAHTAMSRRHVGALRVPLALVQGGDDLIVPVSDGQELERLARDGGVPDVRHIVVGGANHVFAGTLDAAIGHLVDWLLEVVVPRVAADASSGARHETTPAE